MVRGCGTISAMTLPETTPASCIPIVLAGIRRRWLVVSLMLGCALAASVAPAGAQTPPTPAEISAYSGLFAAAQQGELAAIERLVAASRAALSARDGNGRTPLHVATFARQRGAVTRLLALGADAALLDNDRYDAVTIAAVADDEETLRILLRDGASARLVTSRYDGTALIAAAHLGGRRTTRSCQQPALDGADRGGCPGRRRCSPPARGEGAARCRRQHRADRCPGPHGTRSGAGAWLRGHGQVDRGARPALTRSVPAVPAMAGAVAGLPGAVWCLRVSWRQTPSGSGPQAGGGWPQSGAGCAHASRIA